MAIHFNTSFAEKAAFLGQHKSYTLDKKGDLKKLSLVERAVAYIFPWLAARRERAAAVYLEGLFAKVGNPQQEAGKFQLADQFMKRVVKSHLFKTGAVKKVEKTTCYYNKVSKLAGKLNLPYDKMVSQPEFVRFAYRNHLHHKVDRTAQASGIGIEYDRDEKDFTVAMRQGVEERFERVSWQQLPTDKKGIIKGYELMAYGWEKLDSLKPTELEPVRIVEDSDKKHKVILISTSPSYNLEGIIRPNSFFGHSWIKLQEPIRDDDNKFTGYSKLYSIGYNLKTVATPDALEFAPGRQHITSTHEIKPEDWQYYKRLTQELLKYINTRKPVAEDLEGPVKAIAREAYTCSSFAGAFFYQVSKVQYDAL
ncbi:MAG: hypothetical protein ACQEP8_04340 [Chlamydiota bacterium]